MNDSEAEALKAILEFEAAQMVAQLCRTPLQAKGVARHAMMISLSAFLTKSVEHLPHAEQEASTSTEEGRRKIADAFAAEAAVILADFVQSFDTMKVRHIPEHKMDDTLAAMREDAYGKVLAADDGEVKHYGTDA